MLALTHKKCMESTLIVFLFYSQTPQVPMVRPYAHDHLKIDNYPHGTNAVICVISYTVKICAVLLPSVRMCSEGTVVGSVCLSVC